MYPACRSLICLLAEAYRLSSFQDDHSSPHQLAMPINLKKLSQQEPDRLCQQNVSWEPHASEDVKNSERFGSRGGWRSSCVCRRQPAGPRFCRPMTCPFSSSVTPSSVQVAGPRAQGRGTQGSVMFTSPHAELRLLQDHPLIVRLFAVVRLSGSALTRGRARATRKGHKPRGSPPSCAR
jgi:hypothetical protein